MRKQVRQLIGLALVCVILVGGYLLLRSYNDKEAALPDEEEGTMLRGYAEEEIIGISYNYENTNFSFAKGEDAWYSVSDPDLSLKQYPFSIMTSYLAKLRVKESLGEVTDLSMYGLSEPAMKVHFETEKESCTVLIGDENRIAGGWYISIEGEEGVYLAPDQFATVFYYNLEDLTDSE